MKHLVKLENEEPIYEIGDYILLKSETKWSVDRECKIIDIHIIVGTYKYELVTFLDDEIATLTVYDFEIDRKLTPEEIEKFDIKYHQIKYNL